MKKCPVCAVDVEDNAPFCNICGVNLAGAKDVGPSEVETPVTKSKGKPASSSAPKLTKSKTSFYLPALQSNQINHFPQNKSIKPYLFFLEVLSDV